MADTPYQPDPLIDEAARFEAAYARRGGVTVQWLRAQGRVVAPCPCGNDICEGWQSVSREGLADEKLLGRVPPSWEWPPVVPGHRVKSGGIGPPYRPFPPRPSTG